MAVLILTSCSPNVAPGSVKEFDSPSSFPTGLTWDGQYLWVCDYNSEMIYAIDPVDGRVIKSFDTPGHDPEGLAWDGSYIWHVDGADADTNGPVEKLYIYKIDPTTGQSTRMFEAPHPGYNAEDLEWDGQYLWYIDGGNEGKDEGTSTIFKVDPNTGAVIKSFSAPSSDPSGLAWDGTNLWVTDYRQAIIYRINADDGKVIDKITAPSDYPGGLAWDGRYLWCADWHGATIYSMDVNTSH